ncbi:MAG TPA: twin-arginine translocase subunit TatC [Gemmatimonadales bacterium]|nr:twin-arginine translocase subunit TatC [Gemmatimonadales bacterium]
MAENRSHRGEMPFLDHLEELRWRILWSLLAVCVGVVIGFVIVQHYNVLGLIKRPIVPYLPDGRLYVTRPTDAFLITLKLAALVGLVLAAPIIIWQIWLFLSPALYQREKKFIIPTMAAGLILFTVGITIAYLWVLPAALRMLITFQRSDLQPIFTAEEYFSFATQVIFAFGAMFELPLVIVLLAVFGLVNPAFFQRHRPIALVIAAIAAAFLTPPDAFSMLMLLAPLMALYEGGIIVARMIWKRRAAQTIGAVIVAFFLLVPGHAWAQQPRPALPKRPTAGQVQRLPSDSLPAPPHDTTGGPLDTATARKLGLPTAPSRSFPAPDSVMQALLALPGFNPIRYAADSLVLHADSQSIDLVGHALVKQDVSTLEADTVQFAQRDCRLAASGIPALFNQGTVLVGNRMHYNTCEQYGVVDEALTSFNQSGVDWFLRGGLRVDSASTRIYAGGGDVTSCDLPEPHYHFQAGKVKWVTNTILVARPAVLYVRDVPVLWLPFMFQDMHPGRKSGILVPHFGINDLVRPNRGYRRHITNVGYYFALSDYVGAEFWLDWYAGNYYSLNGEVRYKWRNRFLSGGLSVTRIYENGVNGAPGGRSLRLRWGHQQSFDMNTTLNASVDYATSASVVERNAVDPMLATATLASNINFTKRFSWGSFALGASRRQDLTNGSATQTLPSIALTPSAIRISNLISWSPSFSFTNQRQMHQPGATYLVPPVLGDTALPYDTLFGESRNTSLQIGTPVTIGQWTWQNSFSVTDQISNQRDVVRLVDPANPSDSTTLTYGQTFSTGIDWNTGISLPTLFPGSWKLQPTLGIQNTTGGPFIVRNRNTGGAFVHQGKRFSLGASLSPTFFGFFPGIGPLARIRHSITPLIRWNFAPSATVPEAYARAIAPAGQTPVLTSPTQQSVSIGLSQVIEGKFRPAPGDTTGGRNARKLKILSIQTSPITYDFEQAKEPGHTGWQTQTLTNSFQSDLLPGFSLTLQHNLWDGQVGTDSAKFSPFLSNVSARFSISQSTLEDLLGLFTGSAPTHETPTGPAPDTTTQRDLIPQTPGTSLNDLDRGTTRASAHQPFTASFTYDDQRTRPGSTPSVVQLPAQLNNRTLGVSFSFDPTRNWSLSWSTQYNLTTKQFGQHIVRLERNLHRWKATFQFLKSPNGNFAFNFFISLLDEPDIRFQYQQQTLQQ